MKSLFERACCQVGHTGVTGSLNMLAAARDLGTLWGHRDAQCSPDSQSFPAPLEV